MVRQVITARLTTQTNYREEDSLYLITPLSRKSLLSLNKKVPIGYPKKPVIFAPGEGYLLGA